MLYSCLREAKQLSALAISVIGKAKALMEVSFKYKMSHPWSNRLFPYSIS